MVSDAGTPGISDPGAELAAALVSQRIPVHPVPGPSAVIAALSISGFVASEFTFLGFLAVKGDLPALLSSCFHKTNPSYSLHVKSSYPPGSERNKKLQKILQTSHPVVLYEAPHRMKTTFQQLCDEGQGDRPVVCCRELTKMYEEFKRGTVREILTWLESFGNNEVPLT